MLKPGNRQHWPVMFRSLLWLPASQHKEVAHEYHRHGRTFLATSIELATANVLNSGGPFGAVIVTADGQRLRRRQPRHRHATTPRPTPRSRPSATPCRELGTFDLSGATLYTSCEPCPMCLASALWARVEQRGFRGRPARRRLRRASTTPSSTSTSRTTGRDSARCRSRKLELGDPQAPAILEPFNTWNTLDSRIDY